MTATLVQPQFSPRRHEFGAAMIVSPISTRTVSLDVVKTIDAVH